MSEGPDRFAAAFPPHPAHAAVARLFAAAIARHYGLDEPVVEDVKLAVSEAFALALRGADRAGTTDTLHVRAAAEERRVVFEIPQPDGPSDGEVEEHVTPTPDFVAAGLGLEVIRNLFDDAGFAEEGGHPVVRFSAPRDS